jgi:hypothetical protein
MARYYLISKLDEKKAFKLTYDDNKEDIIFRDYERKLLEIDHDKYIKLLEIIGTNQAKIAATWLKLIKKYKKDGCFGIIKSNPIVDDIIKNAKAYVKDNLILIKYGDATLASIPFSVDIPEVFLFTFKIPNGKELKFQEAIDLLIEYKKQKLNENDFYPIVIPYCTEIYDVHLDFSGLYEHGFIKGKNKSIPLSNFIKEIDVDKINDFIYSIKENDTIEFKGNAKAVMFLDKALSQIDLSKVKNKYLRRLIRFRQKHDIYTAMLLVNQFTSGFGLKLYETNEFPKRLAILDRKIKIKKDIKYLNKIKLNGLEKDGFYINPDGTFKIIDYKTAKYHFDMSFIIHYKW